ncbi:hypothetical protein B7486_34335 [cyanobacterium TDX16]|nr:hypothetical protein B7486_34335 [cyanobacterium TDX16]
MCGDALLHDIRCARAHDSDERWRPGALVGSPEEKSLGGFSTLTTQLTRFLDVSKVEEINIDQLDGSPVRLEWNHSGVTSSGCVSAIVIVITLGMTGSVGIAHEKHVESSSEVIDICGW